MRQTYQLATDLFKVFLNFDVSLNYDLKLFDQLSTKTRSVS